MTTKNEDKNKQSIPRVTKEYIKQGLDRYCICLSINEINIFKLFPLQLYVEFWFFEVCQMFLQLLLYWAVKQKVSIDQSQTSRREITHWFLFAIEVLNSFSPL